VVLIKEIVRWIFERDPRNGREPIHLGFELDSDLVASLGFDAGQRRSCFLYSGVPFEFVPFGWQGGDALQYGHLVHAPELGQIDYPVGSFSPSDDTGVWWLGDDTRAGIQNLLSANLRVAQEDPDWGGTVDDFLGDEALVALCERFAFQLVPTIDPDVTRGGRSDRRIAPLVPPGWLFKPTRNGVGVLAPEASFASLPPCSRTTTRAICSHSSTERADTSRPLNLGPRSASSTKCTGRARRPLSTRR